jgi:hypothetical protein
MTIKTLNHISNSVFELRDINPSQLDVSSRQINYWIHNIVVPFTSKPEVDQTNKISEAEEINSKKTKWVRLNLSQAVWVSIVNELFKFNVPLSTMQELAYKVWQQPRVDCYADEVFQYHIDKNSLKIPLVEVDKLKSHLRDEQLMEHHFRTIINPFTNMVKSAIYNRSKIPHTLLYIPDTNDYEFKYGDTSLIVDLGSIYLQKPMISIPITPIIAKVLLVDFDNKKKKDLDYLTNVERQIRDIVVFKRPKVVEIAFEDEQIKPIVVTEKHQSREQLAEYILNNKIKKGSKLLIDIRSSENYKITLIKK